MLEGLQAIQPLLVLFTSATAAQKQYVNEWVCPCSLQKQALSQMWLVGYCLPTPGLNSEGLLMKKAMVGLTPSGRGHVSSSAFLQFS